MSDSLLVLAVAAVTGALMLALSRRAAAGWQPGLRPLSAYRALRLQVGRAIESGQRVHVTLGRGGLDSPAALTSVAALTALDHLAVESCASGVPPLVSLGEATLLPAAQDSLRHGFERAGRRTGFSPTQVHFLAAGSQPMAYAAGVTQELRQSGAGSNLMLGRFGAEIVIMADAAARANLPQLAGSDDPLALAVASSVTADLLIGEELLAAGAYLDGRPLQVASVQVQDIARLVVMVLILVFALLSFLGF